MANSNEIPRKRAKKFTQEEEVLLVYLVENHKNCIENKKSDAVIWRQKEEAWQKIEEEFAAVIGVKRNWKALRDKYEVIKRRSKLEMAEVKMEKYRTGGGVSSAKITPISTKISSMLGDSATGLQNAFDSDCILVTENSTILKDLESSFTNDEVSKETDILEDKGGYKSDWSTWNPSSLKQPKTRELSVKKKRNAEEEKLELIILQQEFYKDENRRAQEKHEQENRRAQEKHEQELLSLKLKNEILQLELAEKNQTF